MQGSLTVCEGISTTTATKNPAHLFPHCMWGYIGLWFKFRQFHQVPSLYVRVYRHIRNAGELNTGFPHCMWGYITLTLLCRTLQAVPSLYVRVYRRFNNRKMTFSRSLTIREGISDLQRVKCFLNEFPHYAWVYVKQPIFNISAVFFVSKCMQKISYFPAY